MECYLLCFMIDELGGNLLELLFVSEKRGINLNK